MKRHIKKLQHRTLLMLLSANLALFSLNPALAQSELDALLPASYPEKFDFIGLAYEVNRAEAYIDVLARHYPLAPSARFYTAKSNLNSLSDIKKDSTVGLIFDSRKRVIGIYDLPTSMYKPN